MAESKMLRRGRQEAELTARRRNILQVIRLRFGAAASIEFTAALDEMDDLGQLGLLLELAVTCQDMADFRVELQSQQILSSPDPITGYQPTVSAR